MTGRWYAVWVAALLGLGGFGAADAQQPARSGTPVVESAPAVGQASQLVQVEVLAFAFRDVPSRAANAPVETDYASRSVPPPAPAAGLKLGTAWQRLHDDPATRPLVHLRWRQELYAQQWIRLEGGVDFDGRLLLKPGRPLRVSLEATMEPGSPHAQQLALTRSTQFGAHLYFDHRAFGVIVRIDPVLATPPAAP